MAINKELTDLEEITEVADGDFIHVVKVSDTTASPEGTSKKVQKSNLGIGSFLTLNDVDETTYIGKEGQFPFVSANQTTDPATRAIKFKSIPTFKDLYGANAVVKGGVTNRTGSLLYEVYASIFIINNLQYSQLVRGEITLADGDATNPRIDLFVVQATTAEPPVFSIVVVEGTPAATPVKPVINPLTQAEITFATIPALATVDPNTSTEQIYDENSQEPTEWDATTIPVGADMVNTVDPKVGTYSILLPAYSTEVLGFTKATAFDYNAEAYQVFYMRIASGTTPDSRLQFKLKNGSDFYVFSSAINLLSDYGFSTSSTAWQLVSIPLNEFTPNSGTITSYDEFEITFTDTPILQLDWIGIQSGISQNPNIIGNFPTAYLEFDSDAKEIKAFTDGTQRMVIADDGDVGIGTTAPSVKLDVYEDSTFAARIKLGNNDSLVSFNQQLSQFAIRSNSVEFVLACGTGGTANDITMTRALTEVQYGTFLAPVIRTAAYTVATLPTGTNGDRIFITDSNATYASLGVGVTATGGGSNDVPMIFLDGAWVTG
jgi:hypothetical protein